jgi:hypothetical protein
MSVCKSSKIKFEQDKMHELQFSKNHKLRWIGMAQSENYKLNYLLSKCETATNHMVF